MSHQKDNNLYSLKHLVWLCLLSAILGVVAGLLEVGILIFLTIQEAPAYTMGLDIVLFLALPAIMCMAPFFPIAGGLGGLIAILIVFFLYAGTPSKRALTAAWTVGGALGGLAVPWLMLLYGLYSRSRA